MPYSSNLTDAERANPRTYVAPTLAKKKCTCPDERSAWASARLDQNKLDDTPPHRLASSEEHMQYGYRDKGFCFYKPIKRLSSPDADNFCNSTDILRHLNVATGQLTVQGSNPK